MSGVIPPLPQYAFVAWCLVKKHLDDLPFCKFLRRNKIAYAVVGE